MLCTVCKKKEATVHLTQIVGDKLIKVDLCEECAKEKGIDDPTGFALAEVLMGLGVSEEAGQTASQTRCPQCGCSHADFKKTGRLGCPKCYEVFAEELAEVLKSMHRGARHVGKAPRKKQRARSVEERIELLQRKLEQAVAVEEYEEAARLRDEIRTLKKE
ncbi:MAG: UvrB/UvrC motif-containing protein [Verrucomicrobia bacterium]|nr:UvrB/UvrC motif-containing protein [Verrucomicrobiota bacterium]